MNDSKLKLYSFGVVAENKPMSTDVALVVPVEVFPLADGELAVDDTELVTEGEDEDGKKYSVKVVTRLAIKCKWLQMGTNRHTSPDVRRGERVAIYRWADSDIFYWVTLGLDDHLRRLETVIWRFSDVPDGLSDEPLSIDNCHTFEISAHRKLLTLTTAQSNEEPYGYTFQFNLGEGCVTLADTDKNYFEFDSSETKLTMQNRDGTFVSLDKKDLKCNAPRDFLFTVGRDFTMSVGRNFRADVKEKVTYTCTNWLVEASSSFNVDCPESVFTGNLSVQKKLAVTGGISGGGSLSITGSSEFSGAMKANGITSPKPISGPSHTI